MMAPLDWTLEPCFYLHFGIPSRSPEMLHETFIYASCNAAKPANGQYRKYDTGKDQVQTAHDVEGQQTNSKKRPQ
jgi:hypothetical protein